MPPCPPPDPSVAEPLEAPIAAGAFAPNWASLSGRQPARWFADAKFGIWAHWGPQSRPGSGDWNAFYMYQPGSPAHSYHLKHYGHPSKVGFKDVIASWRPERFDPDALAALYRKAGARYLVGMANHHDNFDLWNSPHQPWNSVNLGPRCDVMQRWREACRRHDLRFGVSIHNINTWGWFDPARQTDPSGPFAGVPYDGFSTLADTAGTALEGYDPRLLYGPPHRPGPDGDQPTPGFIENWFLRTRQLIDDYHPDLLVFDLASPTTIWRQWVKFEDSDAPLTRDQRVGMTIAAHFFNRQRAWKNGLDEGVLTLKQLPPERRIAATLDLERDFPPGILEQPWQLEETLGDWHYLENDRFRGAADTLARLIETVCRNGNLLLNVVQKPDGTLAGDQQATLLSVGRWLEVNGEAIYGTRPWRVLGEGPGRVKTRAELKEQNLSEDLPAYTAEDIRFTTRGDTLFALVMKAPVHDVLVRSLAGVAVRAVSLLGHPDPIAWRTTSAGLVLSAPATAPCEHAVVYRIELAPHAR